MNAETPAYARAFALRQLSWINQINHVFTSFREITKTQLPHSCGGLAYITGSVDWSQD
jgi:hypothetical protein